MENSLLIAGPLPSAASSSARSLPFLTLVHQGVASHPNANRLDFFAGSTVEETGCERKIEASIAYMTQHLNQPLQVETLAAMVNISPSHYFALFKRRTGCAPMGYFTRLRMEEARRLLETSDASVKEVAARMGYDDPFYFSRVFKSVNQLAPSNYRMRNRSNGAAGSEENPPCES
jgi:transcriptional regulator GlxA family with amidase domain